MVKRLHDAGIEVILDVVYNHTAEGNHLGPTLSFRGIDNATYYRLRPDNPRLYVDDTGCGNTLNLSHPRVLQLVIDSLRYWVEEMHVDGFRFDLATTLGREDARLRSRTAASSTPSGRTRCWRGVKLIAEPWDLGPGGYQVGNFPPGWAEWNDRYRDAVRQLLAGRRGACCRARRAPDRLGRPVRAPRPARLGQRQLRHRARRLHAARPRLLQRQAQRGERRGQPRRPRRQLLSWNCGVEGPTDDPAIMALRERQKRNLLATLLLSQGTPMLLGGDEIGRTQAATTTPTARTTRSAGSTGSGIAEDGPGPDRVRAPADRAAQGASGAPPHPLPARPRALAGRRQGHHLVQPDGGEMTAEQWQDRQARCLGLLLNGRAGSYRTPDGRPADDDVLLIMLNAYHDVVPFTLPAIAGGGGWRRLLDTTEPELAEDATVRTGRCNHSACPDVRWCCSSRQPALSIGR